MNTDTNSTATIDTDAIASAIASQDTTSILSMAVSLGWNGESIADVTAFDTETLSALVFVADMATLPFG